MPKELSIAEGKLKKLLEKRTAITIDPAPSLGPSTKPLTLVSGGSCMRQPGKGGECEPQPWRGHCYCDEDCGEDSFLLDDTIIGVADGVGGWREEGICTAAWGKAHSLRVDFFQCGQGRTQCIHGCAIVV